MKTPAGSGKNAVEFLKNSFIATIKEWLIYSRNTASIDASLSLTEACNSNLTQLFIEDTSLTTLPDVFKHLPHLEMLVLSQNQLNTLPESLWSLSNLKHLDISRNNLTHLSNNIGKLENLTFLYADSNMFLTLPLKELLELGSLKDVRVAYNLCDYNEKDEYFIDFLDKFKPINFRGNLSDYMYHNIFTTHSFDFDIKRNYSISQLNKMKLALINYLKTQVKDISILGILESRRIGFSAVNKHQTALFKIQSYLSKYQC
ncbi:MAG: hypothetical protein CMP39_00255 [Rickettsiales bacterium]|nr:hypothetical protein [Rickettsiales bacterium]|tara:strand:+ start:6867 stop:7643 length:777 start_codon:yes stop_codon:yes gene_type:complete